MSTCQHASHASHGDANVYSAVIVKTARKTNLYSIFLTSKKRHVRLQKSSCFFPLVLERVPGLETPRVASHCTIWKDWPGFGCQRSAHAEIRGSQVCHVCVLYIAMHKALIISEYHLCIFVHTLPNSVKPCPTMPNPDVHCSALHDIFCVYCVTRKVATWICAACSSLCAHPSLLCCDYAMHLLHVVHSATSLY